MVDCEFSYKESVKITKGFYKGYTGKINKYEEKKGSIFYDISLDNEKLNVSVLEEDLKKHFVFKIPFLN